MIFLLEIMVVGLLTVVFTASVAVAAVWYKRQTHVRLTPGEMAEDRVKVARAERDIMFLNVQKEVHNFTLDRVLDARTDPQSLLEGDHPLPLRLAQKGYKLCEGSSGHRGLTLGTRRLNRNMDYEMKPGKMYNWYEEMETRQ